MTQVQFNRVLKRIETQLQEAATARAEREIRRKLREERQVIFVRTYTVPAHFRPAKPRKEENHGHVSRLQRVG